MDQMDQDDPDNQGDQAEAILVGISSEISLVEKLGGIYSVGK